MLSVAGTPCVKEFVIHTEAVRAHRVFETALLVHQEKFVRVELVLWPTPRHLQQSVQVQRQILIVHAVRANAF